MRWENLREEEFDDAIARSGGLCVLPIGCLEKHGQHLPVGTDWFIADGVCQAAAQLEDVVLFPTGAWLGDVCSSHAQKDPKATRKRGYIGLRPDSLLDILQQLCDEIARNGFRKILIVNSHGGNRAMLSFLQRSINYERRDYALLSTTVSNPKEVFADAVLEAVTAHPEQFPYITPEDIAILEGFANTFRDGFEDGHASFRETALVMGLAPEWVRTDRASAEPGLSTGRADYLSRADLSFAPGWSANYPNAFQGYDPVGCTENIGKALVQICAKRMSGLYRLLKEDEDCVRMARHLPPTQD